MLNAWMIVVAVLVLYLLSSIKILKEYERGVVFRLGRVLPHAKGPGIILIFTPSTDSCGCPYGSRRWKCLPRMWSHGTT
jgi:regulator of protease activity HflC (stomatin/prohibitin superfamily)